MPALAWERPSASPCLGVGLRWTCQQVLQSSGLQNYLYGGPTEAPDRVYALPWDCVPKAWNLCSLLSVLWHCRIYKARCPAFRPTGSAVRSWRFGRRLRWSSGRLLGGRKEGRAPGGDFLKSPLWPTSTVSGPRHHQPIRPLACGLQALCPRALPPPPFPRFLSPQVPSSARTLFTPSLPRPS